MADLNEDLDECIQKATEEILYKYKAGERFNIAVKACKFRVKKS